MGTLPDPIIAERLGLGPTTITRRRLELGIEPWQNGLPVEWTTGMLNLLGNVPDRQIAIEYEINPTTVKMKRLELGIPPFGKKHLDPIPDLPADVLNLAGSVPDKKLADNYGVSRSAIRSYRLQEQIPIAPYVQESQHKWTKRDEGHLGTMSDGDVARKLGLPKAMVSYRRRKLGIAPKRHAKTLGIPCLSDHGPWPAMASHGNQQKHLQKHAQTSRK